MTVATTILQQLGGRSFVAMTGARHFLDCGNGLAFRLPANFAKGGINAVRVTLEDGDTYAVHFAKVRGTAYKAIGEHTGIYCDMLQPLFTAETGLDTTLPRIFTRAAA